MGRFSFEEADNYGNSGSSFFSLKDDGDTAKVRFMYNDINDVVGYAVHEVEVDGKTRYVNCLRKYNDPKSKCPLCNNNSMQKAKLYIPVYDCDAQEVKLWERGKNFFKKISGICARYSSAETPLVANVFEIERHGKKGDPKTEYEVYQMSKDNTTLEDLPEVPEVIGSIILDKTVHDMEYYLDEGVFPAQSQQSSGRRAEEPTRRTPSRRGDTF